MQNAKIKIYLLFGLLLLFIGQTIAQQENDKNAVDTLAVKSDSWSSMQMDTLRKIENKAFSAGEILTFDVNYGFVTAGEAIIKTTEIIHNGRKCYKVDFIVDSKPFFDWVYKVRDRYSTIIDAEGLFPWKFEQHIREGGFSRDFIADFDQIHHIANTSEGSYPIPPYVHDMLSAFFFARVIDFTGYKPGEKVRLQNFYKDSTYELNVKYKGKQEIEVEAGTFNCIVVEPLAREGGLFKSEGKVNVWLTDDDRRIPVQVSTKVVIGSIDAELIEFSGINGPIPSKIEDD